LKKSYKDTQILQLTKPALQICGLLYEELIFHAEKKNVNIPQSSIWPSSLLSEFKYSYAQGSCNLWVIFIVRNRVLWFKWKLRQKQPFHSSPWQYKVYVCLWD